MAEYRHHLHDGHPSGTGWGHAAIPIHIDLRAHCLAADRPVLPEIVEAEVAGHGMIRHRLNHVLRQLAPVERIGAFLCQTLKHARVLLIAQYIADMTGLAAFVVEIWRCTWARFQAL